MLEKEGVGVLSAANGQEALQLCWRYPDLIVLDLMMPQMDGFQVIAELRNSPQTRNLPIIVVTAMDLTPDDYQLLNGCVEQIFLKKAKSRDLLVNEVCDLVIAARANKRGALATRNGGRPLLRGFACAARSATHSCRGSCWQSNAVSHTPCASVVGKLLLCLLRSAGISSQGGLKWASRLLAQRLQSSCGPLRHLARRAKSPNFGQRPAIT